MRDLEREGGLKGNPVKLSTIRLAFTVLSRILKDAAEHDPPLIAGNPCKRAHPPKRPRGAAAVPKAWSDAQAAAFLTWAREHDARWADMWQLALASGARRNEMLMLKWQDVDLDSGDSDAGITILNGKGGKIRQVPLDEGTMAVLRRRKARYEALDPARVKPSALVFTMPGGDPVQPPVLTQAFTRAVRYARRALGEDYLPAISLHGTRHSMATSWIRSGVPIHVVSQRLGHATVSITVDVYLHVLPKEQSEHVDRVAKRMGLGGSAPTSISDPAPEPLQGGQPG
jgi:integrase